MYLKAAVANELNTVGSTFGSYSVSSLTMRSYLRMKSTPKMVGKYSPYTMFCISALTRRRASWYKISSYEKQEEND